MLKCLRGKALILPLLIIGLFLINHPSSYGSSDNVEEQPQTRPTLIEQGSQWAQDNSILVTSTVVLAALAASHYMTQSDPSSLVLDNCPRGCAFYAKSKHLYAIAENITVECGNYTYKIYGWISSCYDPQRYSLENLNSCLSSCLNPIVEKGISGAKCFDLVWCWAKNTTDILTCNFVTPGWTITNKTLCNETSLQGFERWAYGNISDWFNRTNLYLYDRGFEHPELGIHWQGRATDFPYLWDAWRCSTKALGF